MKGYTIQHSIELLEKQAGSGSGGASTAGQVSYDNTGTGLVATNVQEAINEINTNIGSLSGRFDYSTTEQLVGKWIDGSDLFVKTFTGTTDSSTTSKVLADVGEGNTIRDFDGVIGGTRKINSYVDTLSNSVTWIAANGYQLGNVATGAMYQDKDYFVKVFYTKPAPAPANNTRSKKSKKEE